jgi:hypothetical protein
MSAGLGLSGKAEKVVPRRTGWECIRLGAQPNNLGGESVMCSSAFAQNTGAPASAQSDMNKPGMNNMEKGSMDKGSINNGTMNNHHRHGERQQGQAG